MEFHPVAFENISPLVKQIQNYQLELQTISEQNKNLMDAFGLLNWKSNQEIIELQIENIQAYRDRKNCIDNIHKEQKYLDSKENQIKANVKALQNKIEELNLKYKLRLSLDDIYRIPEYEKCVEYLHHLAMQKQNVDKIELDLSTIRFSEVIKVAHKLKNQELIETNGLHFYHFENNNSRRCYYKGGSKCDCGQNVKTFVSNRFDWINDFTMNNETPISEVITEIDQ